MIAGQSSFGDAVCSVCTAPSILHGSTVLRRPSTKDCGSSLLRRRCCAASAAWRQHPPESELIYSDSEYPYKIKGRSDPLTCSDIQKAHLNWHFNALFYFSTYLTAISLSHTLYVFKRNNIDFSLLHTLFLVVYVKSFVRTNDVHSPYHDFLGVVRQNTPKNPGFGQKHAFER